MNTESRYFFIAGAPKCGTTAMSVYLEEHGGVFVCKPKEPCYWSLDVRPDAYVSQESEYLKLFENAAPKRIRCDASTSTLWSENAIDRILNYKTDAKFLFMLRNPVDLAYALYSEERAHFYEEANTFEEAWHLQDKRSQGECIPLRCRAPMTLQYRHIAKVGCHLERAMKKLDREQYMVLFFDDLKRDCKSCYESVLKFLNLASDGRKEFPVIHGSREVRMRSLVRALSSQPRLLLPLKRMLCAMGLAGFRSGLVKKTFEVRNSKRPLSVEFRRLLIAEFADDVALLESLTGRDLNHWGIADA